MNISQLSASLPKPWLSVSANDLSTNTLKLSQTVAPGGVGVGYNMLYADPANRLNVVSQTAPTQQIAYISDIPGGGASFIQSPNTLARFETVDTAIRGLLSGVPVLTVDAVGLDYVQGQTVLHLPTVCDGMSQATTAYLSATSAGVNSGIACAVGFSGLIVNSVPRLIVDPDITLYDQFSTTRLKVYDNGVFMRGSGSGTGVEANLELTSDFLLSRDGGAGLVPVVSASSAGLSLYSTDGLTRLSVQNSLTPPGGRGVFVNLGLGGYRLPLLDGTAGQFLATNGAGVCTFSSPAVYGLFSQFATQTVVNTTTITSLIGAGVGSLSVPANFFTTGMSFLYKTGGTFRNSSLGQTLRFRLLANAVVLFDTGILTLSNVNTVRGWNIEAQFTYVGVGGMVTNFEFGYTDGNSDSFGFNNQGTSPIDTTILNSLAFTVQWGTASVQNTITSNYGTLTKIY